jgi:ribulose-phosphate 3-epimerase
MLSSNFAWLAQETQQVVEGGADRLHWDIMDGSYVPNLTFGPLVIQSVRPLTSLPFDVHLMVEEVDGLIPLCVAGGADTISFHPEAVRHPYKTIQEIQRLGKGAGIALNPGTSLGSVEALLPVVDFVLIMTVNPGWGGQSFLSDQLGKISQLRGWMAQRGRVLPLHVDGGISPATGPLAQQAGATVLVAGSAIFKGGVSYKDALQQLRSQSHREAS